MSKTVAVLSDEILEVKLEIKEHEEEITELKKRKEELERELIAEAEKQQLKSGAGESSSFSIKEETVPQASDWDAVWQFIKENDYFHMVQKRLSSTACRELWELGQQIPGVNKYTSHKVNVKGVD